MKLLLSLIFISSVGALISLGFYSSYMRIQSTGIDVAVIIFSTSAFICMCGLIWAFIEGLRD